VLLSNSLHLLQPYKASQLQRRIQPTQGKQGLKHGCKVVQALSMAVSKEIHFRGGASLKHQ
jgi:hypothetical protein